jgi:hypothetical protein
VFAFSRYSRDTEGWRTADDLPVMLTCLQFYIQETQQGKYMNLSNYKDKTESRNCQFTGKLNIKNVYKGK